jgi:transposase-like protein
MPKKSKISVAQKQEVVMKLLRREEPTAVLARRYGVSEQSLYRWRDEFLEAGKAALADGKNGSSDGQSKRLQELERDLADRDQVIGELTIANRIFKKLSDGSL